MKRRRQKKKVKQNQFSETRIKISIYWLPFNTKNTTKNNKIENQFSAWNATKLRIFTQKIRKIEKKINYRCT